MNRHERIAADAATARQVEGLERLVGKRCPGSASRPDPGAVPPVDPASDAEVIKPDSGNRKHRHTSPPLTEPERELSKDAESQARLLKRDHRALYAADPRRFRRVVRLAQSEVFRQKPGPKPDRQATRRIARAAQRRARGANWPGLYEEFIPNYGKLNPVTRGYSEDGFRRRVNKYRQGHLRLRKRR